LQIAHKRLLDTVKLRQLHVDSLSRPLKVLGAFRKILAALDTSGSYGKCALESQRFKLSVTANYRNHPP
jgi:hypothetical protein